MLSSNRLSYSLFESNWIDRPESTKKYLIIFGEYLKEPHELVIVKLFPLTLETFTRVCLKYNLLVNIFLRLLLQILKSAYSMLNILKNTKQ